MGEGSNCDRELEVGRLELVEQGDSAPVGRVKVGELGLAGQRPLEWRDRTDKGNWN